ncbi:hypothetical protein LXL04_020563 [Taraxacum kok-saghyz]
MRKLKQINKITQLTVPSERNYWSLGFPKRNYLRNKTVSGASRGYPTMGYPRDAPATVLFGEWFRFVKPSDQQFFFEKTKHTSNFLAFEASLMSIRDNKVLEVEFKFDSICCSLSITTASSNPSAVVPKLPLFYTPSKPFIPAAKTQDPVSPTASNSSSIPKKHSKQPSLELLEQLPILEPAKIHPRPKVPKLPLVVVVTFYPVFPDPYAVIHETILLNLNNNNQIKPITYQKAFSSGIRSSNNPAKKFMAYTRLASMYVPGNSQQRGYV